MFNLFDKKAVGSTVLALYLVALISAVAPGMSPNGVATKINPNAR